MKIVIIDGQGGKMGKSVIEQLKKRFPSLETYAIGTNSIATSAMLKAGATYGAPFSLLDGMLARRVGNLQQFAQHVAAARQRQCGNE